MMRDPVMDDLIRRTLNQQAATGPSAACADAATLAAWSDGTLGRRDRIAVEAHAARCARCQAMLAAMARTAPAPDHRGWWRAPTMRWLVPLTAGAGAVALWVMVPTVRRAPVTTPEATVERSTDDRSKRDEKAPAPASVDTLAAPAERPSASARAATGAPAAAPAAPPASKLEARRDDSDVGRTARAGNRAPAAAESMAATAQAPARDVPTMQRRAFADAAIVVISSLDPNVRWQTTADRSRVQKSVDGGQTWTAQPIGLDAMLTAGFSPSPSICWLVGRSGVVLLTSDGTTWRRVSFPHPTDLVAVRAADDKNATVTTSDGHMFTTTDGGLTWAERPPQEFPAAPF